MPRLVKQKFEQELQVDGDVSKQLIPKPGPQSLARYASFPSSAAGSSSIGTSSVPDSGVIMIHLLSRRRREGVWGGVDDEAHLQNPTKEFTRRPLLPSPVNKLAMKTPKQPAPVSSSSTLIQYSSKGQHWRTLPRAPVGVQSPPSIVRTLDEEGAYHVRSPIQPRVLSSVGEASHGESSDFGFTSASRSSLPRARDSIVPIKRGFDGVEPVKNPRRRRRHPIVSTDSSETEQSPPKTFSTKRSPATSSGSRRRTEKTKSVAPSARHIQFRGPPLGDHPLHSISRSNGQHDLSEPRPHSSNSCPGANCAISAEIPTTPASGQSDRAGSLTQSDSRPSPSSLPIAPPPGGTAPKVADIPAECVYPLPLTLENLFKGGKTQYSIRIKLLSGASKIRIVEVDVKPGWKSGTRITFADAGNERKPGVFQNLIFVIEEVQHERFTRLERGRLVVNLDINLIDALKARHEPRKIVGLEGDDICFCPPEDVVGAGGKTVLKGLGMPIRSKSKVVGRGDLVIQWTVILPKQSLTSNQIHRLRDVFFSEH